MKHETSTRRFAAAWRPLAVAATAVTMVVGLIVPATADTPKRGGTLGLSVQVTTASLDPIYGNAPGADGTFLNLFAEQLVRQTKDGFEPMLAESWEYENDDKAIVFKLRQGVQFQDGTPFNADAVKFNFDRLMDESIPHTKHSQAELFESVEVIDDYTVRINLKAKSALGMVLIADHAASICSPAAIQERGEDFGREPICTGPFIMDSWSGSRFVAKRNPNYWGTSDSGEQLPYLDGVEINVQQNSTLRLVELRSGNVHYIDYLLPKDFEQVLEDPNMEMIDAGKGMLMYIAFNVAKPPFDNIDLREAAALAINREALVKVVAPISGSVLRYWESPDDLWVYDETVEGHVYDLERARAALERSGFEGEVSLMVIQRDPDIQIAQLIQGMFASIGLKMNIEVVERQGFLDKMNSLQHDFLIARMSHGVDPDRLYSSFFDENGVYNVTGVDRAPTTRLVQQARAEIDREKRRELYRGVADIITEGFIFSSLIRIESKGAASPSLKNIDIDANDLIMYREIWLDQ